MPFELSAGDDRVVVDDRAGGRLASLVAGGAERLLRADDGPFTWGCFPMAPWAGRVADAHIAGTAIWLRANHGRHAMHGAVYDQPWTVDDAGVDQVALHCPFPPDRWPLGGQAEQIVRLTAGALHLELRARAGEQPMPVALGWHPWFLRPAIGDVAVRVDAHQVLETSDDLIPTGELRPVDGDLDLRTGPDLGDRRLDHAYVGVTGPATVRWPDLTLDMTMPDDADTAVVHTPARGVCVEPQTAWPDPFTRPERSGVAWLDPHQVVAATTVWSWRAT